jgi:hypothetical protein
MKTNGRTGIHAGRCLLFASLSALSLTMVFGQGKLSLGGNHWQKYWGWSTNAPPPLPLPEAYQLALAHVGDASNRFFCVSATTLDMTDFHFRGWAFTFSSTNGLNARVEVSFDKEIRVDARSEHLIREK